MRRVENAILKQIGIIGQRFEFSSPPLLSRVASESQSVLWVQQNMGMFMKEITAELVTRGLEAAVLARSIQGVRAVKEDILNWVNPTFWSKLSTL